MEMLLRGEREDEFRDVEALTREAFWNVHAPGCDEHYLLHIMRDKEAFIRALDVVAQLDGRVVGNIVYTKAHVLSAHGARHVVISFGPVSVLPAYQGRGIGAALIRHTLARARELGHGAVLIYGDPAYYGRFGFAPAKKYGIGTADGMYAAALLALELVPGALDNVCGRFFEDDVFHVDPDAAQAFEREFPPKEMRGDLPTQARFRELTCMCEPMKGA